jgi:crotonobetainyl-CoA:carnitine CoA-transferase CaiB-like acyl-CoA transferase
VNAPPLEGVRVLALATNIPGPLAAARLRALGAAVVKIEPPQGDPLIHASRAWYEAISTGLDVLTLDLRAPSAHATLDTLLGSSDVLITAMRARSLERIGIVWDSLRARFPRLCYVALSGEAPPHDDRAGHDLTYQARAGTIAPPAMPRALVGDMAAAERVVSDGLALLLARERTGVAGFATVAITDAAADFARPYRYGLTREGGPLGGGLPAYGIYAARDGWIAVAALEPHFIERLQEMLGVSSLDAATLHDAFRSDGAEEWERRAQTHDVPLAAVR